ncbi:MAG TPA: hypothetical protein VLC92_01975 [Rhodocyclaceae bacterium]|nr:hypothetical protein [Rhodocyclaceae bacterium]
MSPFTPAQAHGHIARQIDNLVNITDETGEFLLRLDEGRVVVANGELTQASFGTAMGPDLPLYRDIKLTSMAFGQSMAIRALTE